MENEEHSFVLVKMFKSKDGGSLARIEYVAEGIEMLVYKLKFTEEDLERIIKLSYTAESVLRALQTGNCCGQRTNSRCCYRLQTDIDFYYIKKKIANRNSIKKAIAYLENYASEVILREKDIELSFAEHTFTEKGTIFAKNLISNFSELLRN